MGHSSVPRRARFCRDYDCSNYGFRMCSAAKVLESTQQHATTGIRSFHVTLYCYKYTWLEKAVITSRLRDISRPSLQTRCCCVVSGRASGGFPSGGTESMLQCCYMLLLDGAWGSSAQLDLQVKANTAQAYVPSLQKKAQFCNQPWIQALTIKQTHARTHTQTHTRVCVCVCPFLPTGHFYTMQVLTLN